MRYVQLWVNCTEPGCERKAEQLIPVEITINAAGHCVGQRLSDDLPDGWSWRSRHPSIRPDIRNTFCPMHGEPASKLPKIRITGEPAPELAVVGLLREFGRTLDPPQIQAMQRVLRPDQLIYLMTIAELIQTEPLPATDVQGEIPVAELQTILAPP